MPSTPRRNAFQGWGRNGDDSGVKTTEQGGDRFKVLGINQEVNEGTNVKKNQGI